MKKLKLHQLGKIISGGTPSTTNENYWDGEVIWITPKDLSKNKSRYIYNGERNITQAGLEHSSAKLLPANSVLLSSRAPIGYLAIAGCELTTNQGFKSVICDESIVLSEYLYYSLSTKIDDLISISSGSTFLELSKSSFENFELNIHSIQKQQHIVNIIGSIDDLIECKFKIISNLYEYGMNLCKNLNGVEEIKLRDYINISTGKLDANKSVKDGKYPFFTCSENNLYIDDYAFDTEAILISGNGSKLGYTNFYKGKFNAYQRTYVLTGNDLFYVWFFSIKFNINKIIEQARGSAVPYITKPMLENFSISISDNIIENRDLNLNLQNIVYTILNINNEIQKLTIIKQKYLNKFFG